MLEGLPVAQVAKRFCCTFEWLKNGLENMKSESREEKDPSRKTCKQHAAYIGSIQRIAEQGVDRLQKLADCADGGDWQEAAKAFAECAKSLGRPRHILNGVWFRPVAGLERGSGCLSKTYGVVEQWCEKLHEKKKRRGGRP